MSATDARAQAVLHELRRRDAWVSFNEFGWDIRAEGGPWEKYAIPETGVRKRLRELVAAGLVETRGERRVVHNVGMRNVQVWRAIPHGDPS